MPEAASAHDAAKSVDCKIPGCTDAAASQRGVYGLLCERHAEAKRRERGTPPQNGARPKGEREQAIRDVLTLAKQLDRQAGRIEKLREKATAALKLVHDAQAEHARMEARYLTACRSAGLQGGAET